MENLSYSKRLLVASMLHDNNAINRIINEALSNATKEAMKAMSAFAPDDVSFAIAGMKLFINAIEGTLPEQVKKQVDDLVKSTEITVTTIDLNALLRQQRGENEENPVE